MLDREPVKAPSLASSRPERLERQKFYAPIQIVRLPNGCNQFQIIDESADRYAQLVRVNHAAERNPFSLPTCGFGQQVFVLAY